MFSVRRNEAQEQNSLLDTIFDYIFYFVLKGDFFKSFPVHIPGRALPLFRLLQDLSWELDLLLHNGLLHNLRSGDDSLNGRLLNILRSSDSLHHLKRAPKQNTWFFPGYLLANLDFLGFGKLSWKSNSFTRNEAQEQHSLLDTIFDHIFHCVPPGQHLWRSKENLLYVGRLRRPTCSGFLGI